MIKSISLLLAFALITTACDKVPLTSPTGSTIVISVDKNVLPIGGTATVTAVVIESSGTPVHNGTMVAFSTTLGRVDPVDVATVNGVATTMFIAGAASGTASIHAFSGAASTRGAGATAPTGAEVKIGNAAAGAVSVRAEPSTVPQTGGAVSIIALVYDTSGNPLPGVSIAFATDQGSLAASAALTNVDGVAVTSLTTNRVSTVRATASGTLNGQVIINVVTAPTVTIVSNTTSPTAGSPVAFTVTPATATTSNPIQSVLVDFGDGQSRQLGPITGSVGLTHTYNAPGGYIVTATARDINGQPALSSTSIIVGFASQPSITLTVTSNPVLSSAQGLAVFTVTATPGAGGAPVRSVFVRLTDGTVIYSGTGGGTFAYKFGSGGTYTVTAAATDATGATATTTTVVVVQPYG